MAVERAGTTLGAVLPELSAKALEAVPGPAIDQDALRVSDGTAVPPPCAAALGVRQQAFHQSAGERVRGECHIHRHQRLKSLLAPVRGIATQDLSNDLRWFDLTVLRRRSSARTCLNVVIGLQPKRAVPS